MMKPNIVFFREPLLYQDKIEELLKTSDLFISVGISGVIYPAAGFVKTAKQYGADTVELNLELTFNKFYFDRNIIGKASETLPKFVAELLNNVFAL